jgi:hypothetical protein
MQDVHNNLKRKLNDPDENVSFFLISIKQSLYSNSFSLLVTQTTSSRIIELTLKTSSILHIYIYIKYYYYNKDNDNVMEMVIN